MTYGELLTAMRVDPNNAASRPLRWFQETQDRKIKSDTINLAGYDTYAIVSPLLPGGFVEQFANPEAGINFSHDIVTKLFTPAKGRDFVLQPEQQIYSLYGALITQAVKVSSVGYGATFYSFETIPSRCQPPDYDEVERGMYARVVHRLMFRIEA